MRVLIHWRIHENIEYEQNLRNSSKWMETGEREECDQCPPHLETGVQCQCPEEEEVEQTPRSQVQYLYLHYLHLLTISLVCRYDPTLVPIMHAYSTGTADPCCSFIVEWAVVRFMPRASAPLTVGHEGLKFVCELLHFRLKSVKTAFSLLGLRVGGIVWILSSSVRLLGL